jgi:hypothetical protein
VTKCIYTAWFRNDDVPADADDPDYEWRACFVIDGASRSSAKNWGDRLSRPYATERRQGFLRSSTEALEKYSVSKTAATLRG